MNIIELKDVSRKDTSIYYRRIFTALASLDFMGSATDKRVEFIIETKPTGAKDIAVTVLDPLEYPLIPVIRSIKDLVKKLDDGGALP